MNVFKKYSLKLLQKISISRSQVFKILLRLKLELKHHIHVLIQFNILYFKMAYYSQNKTKVYLFLYIIFIHLYTYYLLTFDHVC